MPDPLASDALREEIARRAYAKFCERGSVHGGDVDDWIGAEREVLAEKTKPLETPKNRANHRSRRQNEKTRR